MVCVCTALGRPFYSGVRLSFFSNPMPASYFVGRRKLYGRIIGVDVDESRQSIHLTVRHLSPVGQILPKTWFDFFMRFSPLAGRLAHNRSKQKPEETKTELLRVQIGKPSLSSCVVEGAGTLDLSHWRFFFFIAGIQSPPVSGLSYRPEEWLEKLAKQRALVSCQVLARQVFLDPGIKEYSKPPKRIMADVLPGLKDYESSKERKMIVEAMKNKDDQTAVCRITYRPSLFQFFPSDVAEALIKGGNASVSSSLFTNNNSLVEETTTGIRKTKALDASQRIQDLRKDVHYLDRLTKSEFEAAKASIGMWSVPEVRASKQEVVEEVEFQTKANPFQKLWRWFRG